MSDMFQDLMDIPKDSDIHGVPKVPGQSVEDLAKQTFLQIIRIMKNVAHGSMKGTSFLMCAKSCFEREVTSLS